MDESASFQQWLAPRVAAMQAFLKEHPEAEEQVREIFDKRLATMDANTWSSMLTNVEYYMGAESADLLAYVGQTDHGNRLQDVGRVASPAVMTFLKKIVSLYGPELARAAQISNQLPHNWGTFFREVTWDYINRRVQLRVRLAKYNGEETIVEGDADSMLELTTNMIRTLLFIPSPEAFNPNLLQQFKDEVNKFAEFLEQPATPAEKPK